MDILLPFVLPAVLFLALEIFWCRPTWQQPSFEVPRDPESQPGDVTRAPDWDPLALPFVQHRLDVLADELELLERDHSIFARAFRTHVAKSAYAALLDDA